jgi:hypothetical protein
MIEKMRTEFDCDAIELFERMGEQQQFALGVDSAALHTLGIPGRTDLDAPVRRIDVHIGRHAGDFAVGIENRPWQHRARRLQAETAVNLLAQIFGPRNKSVPELPQFAVRHRLGQPVALILRQGLKPRVGAAQGDRFKPGHRIPRSLDRHCEERQRRSNPALVLPAFWIASLAFAMTKLSIPFRQSSFVQKIQRQAGPCPVHRDQFALAGQRDVSGLQVRPAEGDVGRDAVAGRHLLDDGAVRRDHRNTAGYQGRYADIAGRFHRE